MTAIVPNSMHISSDHTPHAYAVLGACGRIGKAVITQLLEQGFNAYAVDINKKSLQQLHKSLNPSLRNRCHILHYNLFDGLDLKSFFDELLASKLKVTGFCNSTIRHSSWARKTFEDLTYNELSQGILAEIPAQILLNRATCEYLSFIGGGSLVLISSIQGCFAPKFHHYQNTNMTSPLDYSIAKSSTITAAKWLSKYYAGRNISINTISPGGILDNQPASFLERYRLDCSNKGMLFPSDIAPTVVHLLQESSRYINGQNIIIDDGWSL